MYDSSSYLINKTTTGCVPESGAMPRTTAAGAAMYNNPDYTFGGVHVPCINNTQVSQSLHFLSAFRFCSMVLWALLICFVACLTRCSQAWFMLALLINTDISVSRVC